MVKKSWYIIIQFLMLHKHLSGNLLMFVEYGVWFHLFYLAFQFTMEKSWVEKIQGLYRDR